MEKPQRSPLRIIGIMFLSIIGAVLLLIVLAVLAIGTPFVSAKLGTYLTHSSGRNIALKGDIETHLWSREPRIIFNHVQVGNAEWSDTPDMFDADRIELSIRPMELFKGRIVLPELIIDKPVVMLEKNDKGDANWEFGENPQAQVVKKPVPQSRYAMPVIHHLRINEGELTYRDPKEHILSKLKIASIKGDSAHGGSADDIHINGQGSYQNQPFLIDLTSASILQLRESNKPYPFSLKTSVGQTSAQVEGTVQDPVKMEAFDVTLDLKGANTADLFPVTGIALPPSPPYEVRGHLTRKGDDWDFEQFKGNLGTSDLSGHVVWHPNQKTPYFEGAFISDNLNMADLAGFVGGHKKPEDPNRVIPDTPLDISRLKAMNADVTFRGRHVRTPDLLDDFFMKIALKDGTLTLAPISFGIAQGTIAAQIHLDGNVKPPTAKLDVDFRKISLADLFQSLADKFGKENVSAGLLGGKATLTGTGQSLRDILATSNGNIGFGMEGGRLSELLLELAGLDIFRASGLLISKQDKPVDIHCLAADFDVTSGLMQTQAFLIDTDVSTIKGNGNINLKDESVDMKLHVNSKKPSPLSARTPIVLSGTLKQLHVGVDVAALAERGGAAVALGVALTPVGALIAFIEPGLGKDSNCSAFLHRLESDTGVIPPPAELKAAKIKHKKLAPVQKTSSPIKAPASAVTSQQ